ncbi:MAG TPA: hypothetical protein VE988_20055 [Gemmataceae bacterium]|nr:hypothetical protein [Gemmataceae bacterium]
MRRYEVLLPARFNDGQEVPHVLLGEAVKEIVKQFEAVTYFENAAQGHWQHGETIYRDDLGLIVVDIPDTPKNRKWMKAYKARWKERLEQLEIWMVSYRIDID